MPKYNLIGHDHRPSPTENVEMTGRSRIEAPNAEIVMPYADSRLVKRGLKPYSEMPYLVEIEPEEGFSAISKVSDEFLLKYTIRLGETRVLRPSPMVCEAVEESQQPL